jgi:DNA-binding MarR family transcriptional regulator
MASLKHEIAQERPFSSAEEETLLNVMRTADCLQRAFQRMSREWGVTNTQYNVLRILRGSHPQGLTCSAIGDRMITAEPDITRLLARLKALKLIRQQRDRHDRRVVWTQISDAGLELLRQMDPVIQSEPKKLLGHLDEDQLGELTRLLELARKPCVDAQNGVSCDGQPASDRVSCDGTSSAHPKAS